MCDVMGNIEEYYVVWIPHCQGDISIVQPSNKYGHCKKKKYHNLHDSLMSETTVAEPELAGWKRVSDHCT